MQEPTTKDSPLSNLRTYLAQHVWLRRGLRVAVWLSILLVAVLAAISIALHAWILPQVDDFRPKIETFASDALGMPVSIGSISTTKQGWQSEIELHQVHLRNAQGHSDLTIETVQVAASPWRLLQSGINHLVLIKPQLHIRRMPDRTVYVAGVLAYDPKKEDAEKKPSNAGLNWLLSQKSLRIENGNITWHDATRAVAPLTFKALNANLSNTNFLHNLHAQIQAPASWGSTITVQGRWRHGFTQPAGNWQAWTGKADLDIDSFDARVWKEYINFGNTVDVRQARGKLLLRTQWHAQNQRDFTIDAQLHHIDVQLGTTLAPLALKNVSAQVDIHTSSQHAQANANKTYGIATKKLSFTTADGQSWNNGQFAATIHTNPKNKIIAGNAQVHDINIALVRQIGQSLPLQDNVHNALTSHQPQGTVEQLDLAWQGALKSPTSYHLRAQGKNIAWLAKPSGKVNTKGRPVAGIPGVSGADFDIDLTQAGGKLQLALNEGHIELPGVFEHPRLHFTRLNSDMHWTIKNGHIQLKLPQLTFSNADAQGNVQATWNTYSNGNQRFPGKLDLTGNITHAKAEKVVRYLPLSLSNDALRYVGASIRSGDVRNARIRIAGDLADIPFNKTNTGVFNFQVPLHNTEFAFMPRYLQKTNDKPWPSLVKLNGLLEIDKATLSLSKVSTRFSNAPDVKIHRLSAHIPNLGENLAVGVAAHLTGSLQQLFDVTRTSPLSNIINQSLDNATATGNTKMKLTLGLPITRIQKSIVRGEVQLNNNDVRITPATPLMAKSTGNITFDERGFHFKKIQTQLLGGSANLQGGTIRKGKSTIVQFKAQGMLSGKGLRAEPTVNTVAALGKFMHGSSPYTAKLSYRAGAPELELKTSLVGMELKLPYPLGKTASEPLPVHFANTIYKTGIQQGKPKAVQDQVHIQLGNIVQAKYIRSLRPAEPANVIQGSIAVGEKAFARAPNFPESGVQALVLLEKFNADAWMGVLEHGWGKNNTASDKEDAISAKSTPEISPSTTSTIATDATIDATAKSAEPPIITAPVTQETVASRYLPNQVAMQTKQLIFTNRNFDTLVVGGSREGRLWKLSLSAKQIIGYVEYLQALHGGAGGVKARLERLALATASVQQVSDYVRQTADPKTLPMLDIDAKNVDVAGYKLNHFNILASNSRKRNIAGADLIDENLDLDIPNAWNIHTLKATMPHSKLRGSGAWELTGDTAQTKNMTIDQLLSRHVNLQVHLSSSNLGSLLEHLGYKKFAKDGSGLISGTLRWNGSPVSPDWDSLSGDMRVDVRQGNITKINPGAAKLLGLLSLQGLTKLGQIAEKGFSYDRIQGRLIAQEGMVRSNNLSVQGSLANVKISGQAHLIKQTMQLDVVVLPKIDLSAAALLTSAINPIIGIGSYLAQWIISKPLSRMARQVLSVTGSWNEPKVQRLKGKKASTVARRVLSTHELPTAFNRLWDWSPITKKGHKKSSNAKTATSTTKPAPSHP